MLILAGVGPTREYITNALRKAVEKADIIYVEAYTNYLPDIDIEKVLMGKKYIIASRKDIENNADCIIKRATNENVLILCFGDPLVATTHYYFIIECRKRGIKYSIIHAPSILDLALETGLHPYKFGKIASIPFPTENFRPKTPYLVLKENLSIGAHTLFLLDLDPESNRFLTIKEAVDYLLSIEEEAKEGIIDENTEAVGCARLGCPDQVIVYSSLKKLRKVDFGKPPYCLIIPGPLHFTEKEALETFRI